MGPICRLQCPILTPSSSKSEFCVFLHRTFHLLHRVRTDAVKSVISFIGTITWPIYTEGSMLHKCSFSPSFFKSENNKQSPSVVSFRGSNFGRKSKLPALPLSLKSSGEILARYKLQTKRVRKYHARPRIRAPRGCERLLALCKGK